MKTLAIFLVYLAGALVLGAILSYPLYGVLDAFTQVRFPRLVGRMGMLVAVLGFVFLLRFLDMDSREALGYGLARREFIARVAVGGLLGGLMLGVLVVALVVLGVRVPAQDVSITRPDLLETVLAGLANGLLVGFIEETFFRGAVFGAVARRHSVVSGVVLSSLLYAALHFVKPVGAPADAVLWYSGLVALGQGFGQYLAFSQIADSFLALFLAGVFLALVRVRSGHIAYCIGLHAGWVLVIKVAKHYTDGDTGSALGFLVGTYDGIIGYLAAVWIILVAGGYIFYGSRSRGKMVFAREPARFLTGDR